MKQGRQTIIGKNALVIAVASENNMAAQVFNYDAVREVRADIDTYEVKVLMNYDDAYFRVFQVKPKDGTDEAKMEAKQTTLKFYNDLLNASMKLSKEEWENIKKQREAQVEKIKSATDKKSVETKAPKSEDKKASKSEDKQEN